MGEIDTIHPLVEQWLTEHGYNYEHEYRLTNGGRVDFLATHKEDGHQLLVEAKGTRRNNVIEQILGYGKQIPDAKLYIALPKAAITHSILRRASEYNIEIIILGTDETRQMEHIPVTEEQAKAIKEMAFQNRKSRAELWREAMAALFAQNKRDWPEFIDNRRKAESEKSE